MPKVKKQTTVVSDFLSALQFCKLVTKKEGAPFETHVLIKDHWAIASNGVLAAGQKINEDIHAAPNNELICQALSKCGEQFSITQLDNNRLSIKSNKFKAIVPCLDPILLTPPIPDPSIALIDDRFKTAIEAVGVLPSEGAQSVVAASILMAGGSVIATDRKVMMEYWHGIDMPIGIALPKAFAITLSKCSKKLKGFGFSQSSATFYFDDDSWLKTQFFAEPWPDVKSILDRPSNAWLIPNDFYIALDAIEPFSETGDIYFDNGFMRSHNTEGEGASYEIFGLKKGPVFSIDQLNIIRPYVKMIDFAAPGVYDTSTMCVWFGDNVRGAIAGRK